MFQKSVLHASFSPDPYWWEDYRPTFSSGSAEIPASTQVAIVGGGYAGLSCALELARFGIEAVVLEAAEPGIGASTRSGGAVSGGLHVGKTAKKKGLQDSSRADSLRSSAGAAFDHLDALIARENIACHWEKKGRFVGAWTPEDHVAQRKALQALPRAAELGFRLVSREEQRQEIASDFHHGGLIADRSGKLHPALYFKGLLDAAVRVGATVCGNAEVTRIDANGRGWSLVTKRGSISAQQVVIATNGYTGSVTQPLRRRLIPVCSHIIATEPLPPDLAQSLLPTGRSIAETQRVLCYYRMSPDGTRLIFGGRARFTPVGPKDIAAILHRFMSARFPQLADTRVTHAWSGNVALTFDGLPHTGKMDGLHYALGCNGSGIAMMTYLGARVASRIAGKDQDICGFELPDFPTFPLYTGDPSLVLPAIGSYYRLRDQLSRGSSKG
jgi:glycine/D-amino acid oxidase-like deaminating enzyme